MKTSWQARFQLAEVLMPWFMYVLSTGPHDFLEFDIGIEIDLHLHYHKIYIKWMFEAELSTYASILIIQYAWLNSISNLRTPLLKQNNCIFHWIWYCINIKGWILSQRISSLNQIHSPTQWHQYIKSTG